MYDRKDGRFRKGFTLVELLVTISIMMIASSLIVVGFGSSNRSEFRREMDEVKSMLQECRQNNMQKSGTWSVSIEKQSGNGNYICKLIQKEGTKETVTESTELKKVGTVTGSEKKLQFASDGSLKEGNDSLTFTGDSITVKLHIAKNTGYVFEE